MIKKANYIKNVFNTFLSQIGIFLLTFIINIILARYLGAANLGVFTFILLVSYVLVRFLTLGIESANVYHIGTNSFPIKIIKSNTMIYWVISGIIGLIIITLILQFGLLQIFHNIETQWMVWTYPIFLIFLFEELALSMYLGLQKIKIYNTLRLLRHALFFCTIILILILKLNTLDWYFKGLAGSLFLYSLLLLIFLKPTLSKPDSKFFYSSFRYGIKAYIANIASFLNYRLDMFFVAYFLSSTDLGYYAVAVLIGEKLWYLASSSSTILFPTVSASLEKSDSLTQKVCRINFAIIFMGAIILGFLIHSIIEIFYTSEYLPAVRALIALLPGIVALSIPKLLAADLSGRGKPQFSMVTSLMTLVLNIILNIILIPIYGIVGAAIASSISYILTTILFMVIYKKETSVMFRDLLVVKKTDLRNILARS